MKLQGVFTAIITPMYANGEINFDLFAKLIETQIADGITGLVIAGSTGEASTLKHQEKLALFKKAHEIAKDRVPLIASSGTSCTQSSIELTQQAYDLGYRYSLLICPYGNKPTQHGLYEHYKAIADATPHMQHILYSIPGRCVIRIENETVIALSKIANIVGLKDSSSSAERIQLLHAACGNRFALLSSDDEFTRELIRHGGDGVISVASNVIPQQMLQLVKAALARQETHADEIDKRLQPLFKQLFCQTNPIPIKALMHHLGKIDTGIRLPLTWLEKNYEKALFDTYSLIQ